MFIAANRAQDSAPLSVPRPQWAQGGDCLSDDSGLGTMPQQELGHLCLRLDLAVSMRILPACLRRPRRTSDMAGIPGIVVADIIVDKAAPF